MDLIVLNSQECGVFEKFRTSWTLFKKPESNFKKRLVKKLLKTSFIVWFRFDYFKIFGSKIIHGFEIQLLQ